MGAVIYAQHGDTVDLICHRHYGRTAGVTEQVLDANHGLADLGPVLPMGARIELPDLPAPPVKKLINLWD